MNSFKNGGPVSNSLFQIFDDVKLNDDLARFSYEDLKERLIAESPELDAIGLLLQHGAFVVEQVHLS